MCVFPKEDRMRILLGDNVLPWTQQHDPFRGHESLSSRPRSPEVTYPLHGESYPAMWGGEQNNVSARILGQDTFQEIKLFVSQCTVVRYESSLRTDHSFLEILCDQHSILSVNIMIMFIYDPTLSRIARIIRKCRHDVRIQHDKTPLLSNISNVQDGDGTCNNLCSCMNVRSKLYNPWLPIKCSIAFVLQVLKISWTFSNILSLSPLILLFLPSIKSPNCMMRSRSGIVFHISLPKP